MVREGRTADDDLDKATCALETLLWASGKAGAQGGRVRRGDRSPTGRRAVPPGAAGGPLRPDGRTGVRVVGPAPGRLAVGSDAAVRVAAAEALARTDAKKAAGVAEKAALRPDGVQPAGVPAGRAVGEVLKKAAGDLHYQGSGPAPPDRPQDFDALLGRCRERETPGGYALGAVEGLAHWPRNAESRLLVIGQNEKEPEEVRKAAWRGFAAGGLGRRAINHRGTETQRKQENNQQTERQV